MFGVDARFPLTLHDNLSLYLRSSTTNDSGHHFLIPAWSGQEKTFEIRPLPAQIAQPSQPKIGKVGRSQRHKCFFASQAQPAKSAHLGTLELTFQNAPELPVAILVIHPSCCFVLPCRIIIQTAGTPDQFSHAIVVSFSITKEELNDLFERSKSSRCYLLPDQGG